MVYNNFGTKVPDLTKKTAFPIVRIFLLLLLGCTIIIIIYIYTKLNYGFLCRSTDCLAKTSQIFYFVNKKKDPCVNFYEYACGNLINTNPYLPEKTFLHKSKLAMKTNVKQSDPHHYNLIRIFYQSCLDQGIIYNNIGNTPFQMMVQEVNESNWNNYNVKNWVSLYEIFLNYGSPPEGLIQFFFGFNLLQNKKYLVVLRPPKKMLTITDPKKIKLLYFSIYRKLNDTSNVTAEVETLINFENELIGKYNSTKPGKFDITVTFVNINDLIIRFKLDINWKRLLELMMPYDLGAAIDLNYIAIENIQYLYDLEKIIVNTDGTIISKYLVIRHILLMSGYFFDEILTTRKIENKCTIITIQMLPVPFIDMYKNYYLPKISQDLIFKEITHVKKYLKILLDRTNWLYFQDKADIQDEIDGIEITLGLLNKNDTKKIKEYYATVDFYPLKYTENYLSIAKKSTDIFFINNPNRVQTFDYNYTAYYNIENNQLDISPAAFHHYFITDTMPIFVNYNQFGSLVGQRLALYIFRFIQKRMILKQFSSTTDKFYEAIKCHIDDKNEYYFTNYSLNTATLIGTIYHDIANFGGVKAAYLAYDEYAKENGDSLYLPNMGYTTRQLYWILFAQMVCRRPIISESITSVEYQINGPLRNFEEFSIDFKCPSGSQMNPDVKCNAVV